jgi:hypothetical protein
MLLWRKRSQKFTYPEGRDSHNSLFIIIGNAIYGSALDIVCNAIPQRLQQGRAILSGWNFTLLDQYRIRAEKAAIMNKDFRRFLTVDLAYSVIFRNISDDFYP